MILSFIVTNQSIAEEEDVTGMNGRIVIADDEPITRMDIRDILEEANYNVVGKRQMVLKQSNFAKAISQILLSWTFKCHS